MRAAENLAGVMERLAGVLGGASEPDQAPSKFTPDKWAGILSEKGHPVSGSIEMFKNPACAGTYGGRPFYAAAHRGSEMTVAATCSAPCRFSVVTGSLMAKLAFLRGRRLRFSDPELEGRFVARSMGECRNDGIFQSTEMNYIFTGMMPFFSLSGEQGSLSLRFDFTAGSITLDSVLRRMESLNTLAGMLERETSGKDAGKDRQGSIAL
jgi:hypothetical protein